MRCANGVSHPHLVHDLDTGNVVGPGQSRAQRNRPVVLPIEILRHVDAAVFQFERSAHVQQHLGGRHSVFQSRDVDIRLEARTGLPIGQGYIDLPVDGPVFIVQGTHHDQDFARFRLDGHHRGIRHVLAGVGQAPDRVAAGLFGKLVQVQVECGTDRQAVFPNVERLGHRVEPALEFLQHVDAEVGCQPQVEPLGGTAGVNKLLGEGGVRLCLGDVACIHHAIERDALPFLGPFRAEVGIECLVLGNQGQHRCLGQRKIRAALVEVDMTGGFDAVGKIAVEVEVQIPLEDLLLAVAARQLHCQDQFLDLPRIAALGPLLHGNGHVLDQLLRDGGTALYFATGQVGQECPRDATQGNAGIGPVGAVLHGHRRFPNPRGHVLQRDVRAIATEGSWVEANQQQVLAGSIVDSHRLEFLLPFG